jgi:hypothetical protein
VDDSGGVLHSAAGLHSGHRRSARGLHGTPTSGYDRPLFLGVGLLDRDVPPSSTLTFHDELVQNHQDVELHVYPDEDHSGTVLASMADSTPFLQRMFAPH